LDTGGFGHVLSLLSGEYMSNGEAIARSLLYQIENGKIKTWREAKDEEFGVESGVR
jgi:hypothetical protein